MEVPEGISTSMLNVPWSSDGKNPLPIWEAITSPRAKSPTAIPRVSHRNRTAFESSVR